MIIAGLENIKEACDLASLRAIEVVNEFSKGSNSEKIVIVEEGKGIFIGLIIQAGDLKIATDVLWFVKPEFRKDGVGTELLQAFEFWATKAGANLITMTSLNPSQGKEYFEKKGYTQSGPAYIKEISNGN